MWVLGALAALVTPACYSWVKWEGPAAANPRCDAARVLGMLDTMPEPKLSWLDRKLGALTTPWKRRGISGWKPTYCVGEAVGVLVRDAQRSTDGFWTLDLRLSDVRIDSATAHPTCRFMRIEVEPHTYAETVVRAAPPRGGDLLRVWGVVVIDTDRRHFLEIHPDTGLVVLSRGASVSDSAQTRSTCYVSRAEGGRRDFAARPQQKRWSW